MHTYVEHTSKAKRILAAGNPPYQEADGGGTGKSAVPIYNHFVDQLLHCSDIDEFVVVIPSRWFSGGKGLGSFRKTILNSSFVHNIRYFKNPREVFPTVDINGGVCFLHIKKDDADSCQFIDGDSTHSIELSELDAIPDDMQAYDLIRKVKKVNFKSMKEQVYPRNVFGIDTKKLKAATLTKDNVTCLIAMRKKVQIPASLITRNKDLVNKYKVVVPKAVGGTKATRDFLPIDQFFIVDPGLVVSETYTLIEAFDNKTQAENLMSYLRTDFCRYFLGLRKLTQNLSQDTWSWVPIVDWQEDWSHEKLAKKFNLSSKEIKHIIKMVEEWS